MAYTVRELAELAGVSPRALRYYDAIGLLPAIRSGRNNDEREYGDASVIRLQQILFYRELDFRLEEIRAILDDPAFDVLQALRLQKRALQQRRHRLGALLRTIDRTIEHLERRTPMARKKLFEGFEQKQKEYEAEARQRWGDPVVDASVQRWNAWSEDERARIQAAQEDIFAVVLENIDQGPGSPAVQHAVERLHAHVNLFWDCGDDAFRGLGDLYVNDPKFRATFERMAPGMPEFLQNAMAIYCDRKVVNE